MGDSPRNGALEGNALSAYSKCHGENLIRIGDTNLHVLDGSVIAVLLAALGIECTREVDVLRHKLKRPLYYERENVRRRMLAAERRKVRKRMTLNRCPTREEVLDAWIHAKDSGEAMLRFGGLIEDLECYVDNSLRFGRGGVIVGRASGIKGWLQLNIPVLYKKYTTVMRYKSAAKKMRQVTGLRDPTPISAILCPPESTEDRMEHTEKGGSGTDGRKVCNEIMVRTKYCSAAENRSSSGGETCKGLSVETLRARAMYVEAMENVPDNATRTIARLDELLDPERIEETTMLKTWKEKYENEITVRTKSKWAKRLFRWGGSDEKGLDGRIGSGGRGLNRIGSGEGEPDRKTG